MIELHSMPTPNGQKIMIMLEETGLKWTHVDVDIRLGQQFSPEHIRLSPNNKIPAIIDPDGPGGRYTMMESGAILIYLAEKTGKFLPSEPRKRYDVLQWLMFQVAHIGPMFGQSHHFNSLTKESVEYAKNRYNSEVARLYQVLDNRLHESAWVGGEDYSIADMAIYPWTKGHKDRGINAENSPNFLRWFAAMEARPAVQQNNRMTDEILARMKKAAEGQQSIDIYNTKDNAERHARATQR
jgi:GST-like protein